MEEVGGRRVRAKLMPQLCKDGAVIQDASSHVAKEDIAPNVEEILCKSTHVNVYIGGKGNVANDLCINTDVNRFRQRKAT